MYRVYGDINSGNCYKVKLLLALLDTEHEWRHVDILREETHTDEFRAINANAKIPVLQIGAHEYLPESNAILNYLGADTDFVPNDRLLRARVLQWQFFEQYSHEPYIAVARYIAKYLGLPKDREAEYRAKQEGGRRALAVLDECLSESDYLVGGRYTIADISLYAYTHVAHEGGFDLAAYPHLRSWLARLAAHPCHVTMEQFGDTRQ